MSKLKSLLCIVILLIMGPYFGYQGWQEYSESGKLLAQSESVPGKVTGERTSRSRRSRSFYLTVDYKTQKGEAISKEFKVSEEAHDAGVASHSTTVYYHPPSPSVAVAGDKPERRYGNLLWGFGLLAGGIFLGYKFVKPA